MKGSLPAEKLVETKFQYNGHFEPGGVMVVAGNHELLGNWNPFVGVQMQKGYSKVGVYWYAAVGLPKGYELEYKFVELSPRWEEGSNRTKTVRAEE